MKKVLFSLVLMIFCLAGIAQTNWVVDPVHSSINFKIKHMGISFVQGRFDKFEGNVITQGSTLDKAQFKATVQVGSINTAVEMRDKHLKSDDFFAEGKFPTMTFDGSTLSKDANDNFTIEGNLTVKDVTKKIKVPVTFGGINKNASSGKEVMGLQAKFTINRMDYNINYDPTGAGVAKDVEVFMYFELVKK